MSRKKEKMEFQKDRLLLLMKKHGLTEEGLSNRIERNTGYILSKHNIHMAKKTSEIMLNDLEMIAKTFNIDADYLLGKSEDLGSYTLYLEKVIERNKQQIKERETRNSVDTFIRWMYTDNTVFPETYMKELRRISDLLTSYNEEKPRAKLNKWTPEFHVYNVCLRALAQDKETISALRQITENAVKNQDTKSLQIIDIDGLHITK